LGAKGANRVPERISSRSKPKAAAAEGINVHHHHEPDDLG